MKICVYCASSDKIDNAYFNATEKLALILVKEGIEVVFGGGAFGLMGRLADVVIDNGGIIKGIMPHFMKKVEWTHKKLTNVVFTETMHERKAKFLEGIDALLALPGGCGTLEELLEAITLKRLGLFTKPIIILNTKGYYNPLKEMLSKCVSENFMSEKHALMYNFVDEPEEVLNAIRSAEHWDSGAINFAAIK